MNDREIEKRLRDAIYKTAPNDIDGVLSRVTDRKGRITEKMITRKKSAKFGGAIAACLAVAILGGGGAHYAKAYAVSSIVSLDVNPSIELRVNAKEKVLVCAPLNDEARLVLADMDGGKELKGVDLSVAVNALIGALVRNGYLDSVSSSILISVEDKNEERAAKLRREVTETVDSVLSANSASASVLSQSFGKSDELEELAKTYGISTGKAALASQICKVNASLELSELSTLSVDELNDLLEIGATGMPIGKASAADIAFANAGISSADAYEVDSDIDDIPAHYDVEIKFGNVEYEYKIDAFTGEILDKKVEGEEQHEKHEETPKVEPTVPDVSEPIGLEAARKIALGYAGIAADDVLFTKAEEDYDDGVLEYEFEFMVGRTEYECKVSAKGAVIGFEAEQKEDDDISVSFTNDIGAEAAKSIAFGHAGVSASKVYDCEVECDADDGRKEYEIEFKSGNMEYEYKIDASTGAILSHEAEVDD